jgi:hypothetical protein
MAGSLIKIDEEIVTSAVATVELGGTNWDSSYDVYMVKLNDLLADSTSAGIRYRFLASSSPDTSANYDYAQYRLQAQSAFDTTGQTNKTEVNFTGTIMGTTNASVNGIIYLFNSNNPSEYSFATNEISAFYYGQSVAGYQGGAVLTVAQATNGIQFFMTSGNIASGTFTLYGLAK